MVIVELVKVRSHFRSILKPDHARHRWRDRTLSYKYNFSELTSLQNC
ncbi:MAG: hypothetical protein WBV73_26550 [Phormidium sp.]